MVMRVKASPARDPKALEPPAPPKAPASPPPLPRWMRMSRIRNNPTSTRRMFRNGGNHDQTAQTAMLAISGATVLRGFGVPHAADYPSHWTAKTVIIAFEPDEERGFQDLSRSRGAFTRACQAARGPLV